MAANSSSIATRLSGKAGHHQYNSGGHLENVVIFHLGTLIVVTAWAFGGQSPAARNWLLAWTTIGLALFFIAVALRQQHQPNTHRQVLYDLWPLLVFDALSGLACLNPSMVVITREQLAYLKFVEPPYAWLPSCARPELALSQLWLLNGIILSAYTAGLVLVSRRTIRRLLLLVGVNAVCLAIFGTFQHLLASTGLYFGRIPSPQSYFFASFVYHNHWGAFTLLNTATCLGLLFHALRHRGNRDLWHSPVLAGAVATLLLAATVPLSGSRSSTILLGLLTGGALVHLLTRLIRQRRSQHESVLLPVIGIVLAGMLSIGAIGYLARNVIVRRAALTTEQLGRIRNSDQLDARFVLYRDTWRMAQDKPWFGWGLESYGDVFRIYNTQLDRYDGRHFWQPFYRAAHSDWLQSLAESGYIGTGLLVALGLTPWRRLRNGKSLSMPSRYLLAGCGLILLYALLEFPFANPSVLIAFWSSLYLARRYQVLEIEAESR